MKYLLILSLLLCTVGCMDTKKQIQNTLNPPPNLTRKELRYEILNIAQDSRFYYLEIKGWNVSILRGHTTIFISDDNYVDLECIVDNDTNDITTLRISGHHYLHLNEKLLAKLNRYEE